MKVSTVKKTLRNKIDKYLESINSPHLKEGLKESIIVSGGAVTSLLTSEKLNDYDVYLRRQEVAIELLEYYLKGNSLAGVAVETKTNINGKEEERVVCKLNDKSGVVNTPDKIDDPYGEINKFLVDKSKELYKPVVLTENAISLSGKIQIIVRFTGEPEEIHRNFDFIHCQCYYSYRDDELVLPADALSSLLTKELKYNGSLYPICSIFRLRKYLKRGWKISAGELLKIIFQIQKIDFDDPDVVRDQLLGVDRSYMHQLLNALESHKGKVDETYLAQIVDEVFN